MVLQSMTGFGRGEASNDAYSVTVEIKSVNHRFKDIRFKMSSIYNSIELDLKKALGEKFKRGSFDVYVNFKRTEASSRFDDIDGEKVKAFLMQMRALGEAEGVAISASPTEFLRNEFFKEQDLGQNEELLLLTREAFDTALGQLEESRITEGKKLVTAIENHKKTYVEFFKGIEEQTEGFQKAVEERLKKKFDEILGDTNIDEPRFLQEVVYYLEKMDVQEEITRIHSHLEKLNKLLSSNAEVGRQVDFLMQEFNRETNTIGSKSSLKEISDSVVQMKVQLEKIREQGLNLE